MNLSYKYSFYFIFYFTLSIYMELIRHVIKFLYTPYKEIEFKKPSGYKNLNTTSYKK